MKVYYASDLHFEFNDPRGWKFPQPDADSILLLAGDIVVHRYLYAHRNDAEARSFKKRFDYFLRAALVTFGHLYFIAGNHEPYGSEFNDTTDVMKHYLKNVYGTDRATFLDMESVRLREGLILVGGTLWTDMNKGCETSKMFIKRAMNDFHVIFYGGRKFTPDDAQLRHHMMLDYIKFVHNENPNDELLVMTHHGPTHLSAHRYFDDKMMEAGYHSDCSEFIEAHPRIKNWIHGHTHYNVDYRVPHDLRPIGAEIEGDGCRVVTNQLGYEHDPSFNQFNFEKYIEL